MYEEHTPDFKAWSSNGATILYGNEMWLGRDPILLFALANKLTFQIM